MFVQVEGFAKEVEQKQPDDDVEKEADDGKSTSKTLWNNLTSFMPSMGTSDRYTNASSSLRTCPYDVEATVNGGGLYWRGNKVWDLDFIQGTGLQRVLYADAALRILLAPRSNEGGWEDEGLIVVQVRKDFLS